MNFLSRLARWSKRRLQRRQADLPRLPGTQYSHWLMPLDYLPSRDYQPRWGYTRPAHAGLEALFQSQAAEYWPRLERLGRLQTKFARIAHTFEQAVPGEPAWVGGPINAIDAALLYFFVSELRPKVYLEIGSGVSTLFAARAKADFQLPTRIISIDPEPRTEVDAKCDLVYRDGLETADLSVFDDLAAGDIVYLDGSHRSFMNSDVTVFMLDVLPRLKPGVVVQVHDCHLPKDYPPMFAPWYWNEQYILAVYLLAMDTKINILMPGGFISQRPELRAAVAAILADWPGAPEAWLESGSIWFTKR